MCISYAAATKKTLKEDFRLTVPDEWEWPAETWQDYAAPIIIDQGNGLQPLLATYGMVPKKYQQGATFFSTMNARAETLLQRVSYRDAWRNGQLCLVPMLGFYEPCYESGKAERWRIGLSNERSFAVAGLYRRWEEGGNLSHSFTQITVNADDHPLMRRMHKPGDEKRSLVIIPEAAYARWLSCRKPEHAQTFLRLPPAEEMMAEAVGTFSSKQQKNLSDKKKVENEGYQEAQSSLF